jgi:hypothetical protein
VGRDAATLHPQWKDLIVPIIEQGWIGDRTKAVQAFQL